MQIKNRTELFVIVIEFIFGKHRSKITLRNNSYQKHQICRSYYANCRDCTRPTDIPRSWSGATDEKRTTPIVKNWKFMTISKIQEDTSSMGGNGNRKISLGLLMITTIIQRK